MTKDQEVPEDTLASRIVISKYSNFNKLIRVTARISAMYQRKPRPSFRNAAKIVSLDDITNAENFWIKEVKRTLYKDIDKG